MIEWELRLSLRSGNEGKEDVACRVEIYEPFVDVDDGQAEVKALGLHLCHMRRR